MSNRQNPAMVQWQQRFDQAQAAMSAAKTPQERARALENLRHLQTVRPNGEATKGQMQQPRRQPQPKQKSEGGIFNYIAEALRGARD